MVLEDEDIQLMQIWCAKQTWYDHKSTATWDEQLLNYVSQLQGKLETYVAKRALDKQQ